MISLIVGECVWAILVGYLMWRSKVAQREVEALERVKVVAHDSSEDGLAYWEIEDAWENAWEERARFAQAHINALLANVEKGET